MSTVWHAYDIVLNGSVVYVGMTVNPKRRLAKHKMLMFEGDEEMVIVARRTRVRDAQIAEAARIRKLRPPRNRTGMDVHKEIPRPEQARANGARAGDKRGRPKAEFTAVEIEAAKKKCGKVERWQPGGKPLSCCQKASLRTVRTRCLDRATARKLRSDRNAQVHELQR
jgi:hypothetical protein